MITKLSPTRHGSTTLADGRTLAWSEQGPADGAPVLFQSGAGATGALGLPGDVLDRLGVCLVAIDRPGLGRSTPAPARTLADWPADVRAVIGARRLEAPRALGFSQGAPFALACAAAGIVRGVAIVSGTDELAHPDLEPLLPDELRDLIRTVAKNPAGAETYFAQLTAERLHAMSLELAAPIDRPIYEQPVFAAAFRSALDNGFAQGAGGYARDAVLAFGRWPFDVSSIEVPVELFYGTGDTSPVHSPDRMATLARRIPNAHRHLIEGGGAILWTHAEEILTALLSR